MFDIKYINKLKDITYLGDLVIAHGFFDGVHKGHQVLINECVKYAREHRLVASVITFKNKQVREINDGEYSRTLFLTDLDRKFKIFKHLGIELVIVIDLEDFKDLTPKKYLELVSVLGTKHFIIGKDNHFGKDASGDQNNIALYSRGLFSIEIIDIVKHLQTKISSSTIKHLILNNQVKQANEQLNYYYSVYGKVVKGKQLGRTIGFPTANIIVYSNVIIPHIGVYATLTRINNDIYRSMTNIGYNPTVEADNDCIKVETYILDFDFNIYDQEIEVYFIEMIRKESDFASLGVLVNNLEQDKKKVIEILEDIDLKKII